MRGFDNFFGYLSDQLWYYNHKSPHACKGTYCFYDMNHNGANAENSIGVYSTFLFTDVVQQILEESDPADPLMVYISWQNVHAPLDPPPESYFQEDEISLLGMIDDPYRRTFASMTIILDNAMKKIVGDAKAHGFYDDAILVVASDNGGCPYSGGYNYPLRGAKQYLWEGGIRVNAFVHSPMLARSARGTTYNHLFHVSDWLPTLLRGALQAAPDLLPADLDGIDHWSHMTRETDAWRTPPRTELLHNIEGVGGTGAAVLRVGSHKLFVNMQAARGFDGWCAPCADPNGCVVPDGAAQSNRTVAFGGQLCCWQPPVKGATTCTPYNRTALPPVLLYDIDADPSETTDVAAAKPEVVRSMLTRLAAYNATNAPCCICTGSSRVAEMDEPPLDGYWYSFRDQSPNPDANCALMNEPPWRESGAVEAEAR